MYLGGKETFRSISCRFDVTESTIYKILKRISSAITKIASLFLQWPTNFKQTAKKFQEVKGLPNVIGAIDGSHIPIKLPSVDGECYINRKGFPSIILQGIVDSRRKFVNCYVGWPGSVHDARVFANSEIGVVMRESPMDKFPEETCILGDSAYPLLPQLLTPYRDNGNLNQAQRNYNYCHSVTRNVVERAFGTMKSKFRRLEKIELNNVEQICNMILSACVLHNFCIEENEYDDDDDNEKMADESRDPNRFVCVGSSRPDAEAKRNAIAQQIF